MFIVRQKKTILFLYHTDPSKIGMSIKLNWPHCLYYYFKIGGASDKIVFSTLEHTTGPQTEFECNNTVFTGLLTLGQEN